MRANDSGYRKSSQTSGAAGFRLLAGLAVLTVIILVHLHPDTVLAADMSFDQALSQMLQNNETLQISDAEEENRQYQVKAARGMYLPQIGLSGRITQMDDPLTLDLNPIRDVILALHPTVPSPAVPSFEARVQKDNFMKTQLNLTWPIFAGGRIIAANRAADDQLLMASERTRQTRHSLIGELARLYYGTRLAESVAEVRAQALEALSQHAYQARRLEEEGLIAHTERLHADVARAEADRNLKAARRDMEIAGAALNNVVSSEQNIHPTSKLFLLTELEPLEHFTGRINDEHPLMAQLAAGRDLAGQNVRAEKAQYLPEIYLFGMKELYQRDLTALDPEWAVGVGMNLVLFDGFQRGNKVQAARSLERKAELMKRKAKQDIETLVIGRYQTLMKAREQFDATNSVLNSTRENVRARQKAFEEGFATSLDVVDAELSLSSTHVERLKAAYDYAVALADLLESSGLGDQFPDYVAKADVEVE